VSKVDVNETLKAQSTAGSRHGGGLQALPALMITELALALVILVGAGLMIKSFLRVLAVPKGFNPDGVLTLVLSPSPAKYPPKSPQCRAYFQEVLIRTQALPGIQSASLTSFLPLAVAPFGFRVRGSSQGGTSFERVFIVINYISPDYYQTMGIKLRTGRPFTAQDGNEAPRVAIINESLAHRFFDENPIGRQLYQSLQRPTIIGVVGDMRHNGFDKEIHPEVYLPYMQRPDLELNLHLAVRVAPGQNNPASLSSLAAAIRNQVLAVEPNEPVNQIVSMDERLSNSVSRRRYVMLLFSIFAAVAFVIATVGIYGVISYAVSQRTHEIGIRMALGAQASDVLRMVIWRGMSITLIGLTLGLASALALTRLLKNQFFDTNLLFNVSATDPATFALIALLLVIAALIASYIPARRATKVDPLQALRHE
jgi:putative ABC transport system permease protein